MHKPAEREPGSGGRVDEEAMRDLNIRAAAAAFAKLDAEKIDNQANLIAHTLHETVDSVASTKEDGYKEDRSQLGHLSGYTTKDRAPEGQIVTKEFETEKPPTDPKTRKVRERFRTYVSEKRFDHKGAGILARPDKKKKNSSRLTLIESRSVLGPSIYDPKPKAGVIPERQITKIEEHFTGSRRKVSRYLSIGMDGNGDTVINVEHKSTDLRGRKPRSEFWVHDAETALSDDALNARNVARQMVGRTNARLSDEDPKTALPLKKSVTKAKPSGKKAK